MALLTTTVIWRGTTAYAEDPNQAFTLDPMIVTAQRTETRDLDILATTNIITEQNIKEAGYKNVFDAIEHQVGLTSTGYGDAGQDAESIFYYWQDNQDKVIFHINGCFHSDGHLGTVEKLEALNPALKVGVITPKDMPESKNYMETYADDKKDGEYIIYFPRVEKE